ncbi:MAG: hypothetical protein FGM38_06930 [Solirubrobacterales bacterium]|nr:hypothetical protein [Solirubrobacterales bacterium]
MNPATGHDRAVRVLTIVQVGLGVAIVAVTLVRGGGPLSLGVIIGLALIAVGFARWRLQERIGGDR